MYKQINWFYTLICTIVLTGCSSSTVKVIKPVDISGTDIDLPVTSIAFTSGDTFTPKCRQVLDAIGDPNISTRIVKDLGDFQDKLENALIARGFTFSSDKNKVCIRLQVVNYSMWMTFIRRRPDTTTPANNNLLGRGCVVDALSYEPPQGMELVAHGPVEMILYKIDYLDVKGQTLGIVQQECSSYINAQQAAEEVAEFTLKTFGKRK